MTMPLWLRRLIRQLLRWFTRGPVPFEVAVVSSAPRMLRSDTIYAVTEDQEPWTVAMLCPCGCGEQIYMSLLDESPKWDLELHNDGTPSLHPSVRRTVGCKSHFFLKRGLVTWCR
jgi:hypothetical protein